MEELRALGRDIVANTEGKRFTEESVTQFLAEAQADVAIIGLEPITESVLANCPNLKMISKYGVGLDSLDLDAMQSYGVRLGWTAGVNRRSVSELALTFALGHCRNTFCSIQNMRSGKWLKNGGRLLSNATFGIVGFGHVGSDLASLLTPFGCRILYTDVLDKRKEAAACGAESTTYEDLIRRSDIVSFHVPSTPLTRHMFGEEQIKWAQNHLFVINTARGSVTQFDAVCNAVRNGDLGGYGTDVFPEEPYQDKTYSDVPTLYFTPHIGGNARESVLAMGRSSIQHVKKYLTE